MYNRIFTWVETRAISELRVRLVQLNILKLSSISFTGAAFVDRLFNLYFMFAFLMLSSDINVESLTFTPYCVGVCVCGGGGGDQDVITIQTSP